MKVFVWFVVGIIATFALISFATRTGEGESPLGALGVQQGNNTARVILSQNTPLPTRQFLSFTGDIACNDSTPSTVCEVPESREQDSIFQPIGMSTSVTGTGSAVHIARQWSTATGATAGSTALSRNSSVTGWSRGGPGSVINWSNPIRWTIFFTVNPATTNGIHRWSMGKATSSGVGNCAVRCIGFSVSNLTVALMTHNGTTFTATPFAGVLNTDVMYRLTIENDGNGTCTATLIGAVSTETVSNTTTCPVGLGLGGQTVVQLESENGADAANTAIYIHLARYEIG